MLVNYFRSHSSRFSADVSGISNRDSRRKMSPCIRDSSTSRSSYLELDQKVSNTSVVNLNAIVNTKISTNIRQILLAGLIVE